VKKKNIMEIIKTLRDLPELPSVLLELNRLMKKPLVTVNEINNLIIRDPALTARILRLANSAYYGLPYRVATLHKAVTMLGFNIIRSLGITVTIFKIFNKGNPPVLNIKGLWEHSIACAIASKKLLYKKFPALQEQAFLAGIIHDIGKLIIAQNFPEDMNRILKKLREDEFASQIELEREFIGYTHSDLGAFVGEKWKFPRELSRAIKFHHNPVPFIQKPDSLKDNEETVALVLALHAGNQIAKVLSLGRSSDEKVDIIEDMTWEYLDINQEEAKNIFLDIKEDFFMLTSSWQT